MGEKTWKKLTKHWEKERQIGEKLRKIELMKNQEKAENKIKVSKKVEKCWDNLKSGMTEKRKKWGKSCKQINKCSKISKRGKNITKHWQR